MTDPAPDTQQIEMLKTLLHDSRIERTRLADEVDRLRALADPAPVGLTEDERMHMTNLREAWRRAAPIYTDLAATDVEWLCTLIDRLSAAPDPDLAAVCEALRIAVEACERVAALEATANPVAAVTKDRPDHAFALGMAKAYAKHALAAVRELVDLGGDDG